MSLNGTFIWEIIGGVGLLCLPKLIHKFLTTSPDVKNVLFLYKIAAA